jgi:rhodanese-related sulfurtransferase
MPQALQRALLIIVLGGSLGLLSNAILPKGIPLITPPKKLPNPEEFIALEQAYEFWAGGEAFFLDARGPSDYEAGHIANALSVPGDAFEQHFPRLAAMVTPETPLVIYCDGTECELSHRLADQLRANGYANLHLLQNGWTEWRTAGYLTDTGPPQ